MTKARILADYVAGGVIASEHEYLDGVTSNVQTQLTALDTAKAPKASPAFTGTPTGITAAHITSGVLPVGVTGGSGLDAIPTATGDLLDTKTYTWIDGDVQFTDGNQRIVKEYIPLTLIATNTYVLKWSFVITAETTNSSSAERRAHVIVSMHTSDPGNSGDIFGSGVKFREHAVGRNLISASGTAARSYGFYNSINVVPFGTSGTKYFGLCSGADGSSNNTTIHASGNNHMSFVFETYKGDIDDRTT